MKFFPILPQKFSNRVSKKTESAFAQRSVFSPYSAPIHWTIPVGYPASSSCPSASGWILCTAQRISAVKPIDLRMRSWSYAQSCRYDQYWGFYLQTCGKYKGEKENRNDFERHRAPNFLIQSISRTSSDRAAAPSTKSKQTAQGT